MPQQKPKIDLTNKNSLSGWLKAHSNELWKAFGTGPLYKDYNPNNVIDFIENGIKKDNVYISPEKEKEVINTIKQKGRNVKLAMQYISNLFLRGAGLGLRDSKEELLRKVIKEEIKRILKEEEPNYYKKIQNKLKESKYWKVELSDFIKSNFRKLENQDEISNRDIENVVSSFMSKYRPKVKFDVVKKEVKEYFEIEENTIKEAEPSNYYKKIQNKLKSIDRSKQTLNKLNTKPPHRTDVKPGVDRNNMIKQVHQSQMDANKKDIETLKLKKKAADQKRLNKVENVIREEIRKILKESRTKPQKNEIWINKKGDKVKIIDANMKEVKFIELRGNSEGISRLDFFTKEYSLYE